MDFELEQLQRIVSAYLDLYDKVKSDTDKEKVSILDDVDFELELIHRDRLCNNPRERN